MKAVQDFKAFIKRISKEDKVVLVYDRDGDGVSATAIAKISLSRKGIDSKAVPSERANVEALINELKNLKPDFVIYFDLTGEGYPEVIDALPQAKFMVIDHHKQYGSPKGMLIIKPGKLGYKRDPSTYPTAKMSYDLFSKISDISDLKWMACVGIISDSTYLYWKRFVDSVLKAKKWENKDVFESVPGKVAAVINASNTIYESRIHEAMELMLLASPAKILKSDLAKLSETIKKEVDRHVAQYGRAEVFLNGKLVIFEFKSKYKIAGFVSNKMSKKHFPNNFFLVVERSRGWVKISARSPLGGIPANSSLEKAMEGLRDAKAGGHAPAAGAAVREGDFEKFKKRLIKVLEDLS